MATVLKSYSPEETEERRARKKEIGSGPGPLQMARNVVVAARRFARSPVKFAPQEAVEIRMSICRKCDYWEEVARWGLGKCRHHKCGCTKYKQKLASEECPLGKWGRLTT